MGSLVTISKGMSHSIWNLLTLPDSETECNGWVEVATTDGGASLFITGTLARLVHLSLSR